MDKWSRIKSKIHKEKLEEVNQLFAKVITSSKAKSAPRYDWLLPLENWTTGQIKENTSLRLSLQEYAHLKRIIETLHADIASNSGKENEVINESKKAFVNEYISMLEAKTNDLKLEISAELIVEKQFQLGEFVIWYEEAYKLPPEKFNEELGEFWGDVWRNAARGAGYGGLAGTAAGGPGFGTFAGAGIGGIAGGAWGAGSNLLKRVWHWRQTQRNFEQTKEKAIDALKKLKELGKNFEMHPNFLQSLDSIINQLGTVRPYRMAGASPISTKIPQAPKIPTDQEPEAPEPSLTAPPVVKPAAVNPLVTPSAKPTGPTSSAPAAPVTSAPSPVTAPPKPPATTPTTPTGPAPTSTAPPVTPSAPPVAPAAPPVKKPRSEAQIKASAALAALSKKRAEERAAAKKAAEPPIEDALADAGATRTPSGEVVPTGHTAPTAAAAPKGKTDDDMIAYLEKNKDDKKAMTHVGAALDHVVGTNMDGTLKDGPIDAAKVDELLGHISGRETGTPGWGDLGEDENAIKLAQSYLAKLKQKKEEAGMTTPTKKAGTEGTPVGEYGLKPKTELNTMSKKEFRNYIIHDLQLSHILGDEGEGGIEDAGQPDSEARHEAIKALTMAMKNRSDLEAQEKAKGESVFTKYKKMIQERKYSCMSFQEKTKYLVSMIRS